MKITNISNQQKNKDRVNIFIDNKFAFGLHVDVVLEHRIKIGMDISEDLIEKFQTSDAFRQAYDKALNYLSCRPRSAHEMKQYLRDKLVYKHPDYKELDQNDEKEIFIANQLKSIDQIIQKLTNLGVIDDSAFAKWWISNRQQHRPRGKRLLLLELKAKGISNADIHEALTTPAESGHFTSERIEFNEHDAAFSLAQKYHRKYAHLPENEQKQKLFRYLSSKGFDFEIVSQVVAETLSDN